MEKARKDLHNWSLGLLLLVVFRGLQMALFNKPVLPAGMEADPMAQNVANAVVLAGVIGSVIFMILLAVLCFKGLAESKNPTGAKFHIVLGWILCAFSILGAISSIASLFSAANLAINLVDVLITVVHVVFLFMYARKAKMVNQAA